MVEYHAGIYSRVRGTHPYDADMEMEGVYETYAREHSIPLLCTCRNEEQLWVPSLCLSLDLKTLECEEHQRQAVA